MNDIGPSFDTGFAADLPDDRLCEEVAQALFRGKPFQPEEIEGATRVLNDLLACGVDGAEALLDAYHEKVNPTLFLELEPGRPKEFIAEFLSRIVDKGLSLGFAYRSNRR